MKTRNHVILLAFLGITLVFLSCRPVEEPDFVEEPWVSIPCEGQEELAFPANLTYTLREIPTQHSSHQVQFFSVNEGYVLGTTLSGSYPVLFHTADAGVTWQEISVPAQSQARSMAFLNPDVGFISVFDRTGCPNACQQKCITLKTTNGGQNWTQHTHSNLKGTLNEIQFISPQVGFALLHTQNENSGQYEIRLVKTSDAGDSWHIIYEDTAVPIATHRLGYQLFNNQLIVLGANGTLLKMDLDGNLLQEIQTPETYLYSVEIADAQHWHILGREGYFRSVDGGNTFQLLWPETTLLTGFGNDDRGLAIRSVSYCGGDVYISDDQISVTQDGGSTWTPADSLTINASLYFRDAQSLPSGEILMLFDRQLVIVE